MKVYLTRNKVEKAINKSYCMYDNMYFHKSKITFGYNNKIINVNKNSIYVIFKSFSMQNEYYKAFIVPLSIKKIPLVEGEIHVNDELFQLFDTNKKLALISIKIIIEEHFKNNTINNLKLYNNGI